jgi:murein DD-endopeptidase MepM/ murein hydrolase activator NlpD
MVTCPLVSRSSIFPAVQSSWLRCALFSLVSVCLVLDGADTWAAPAAEESFVPAPIAYQGPKPPWSRRKRKKERVRVSAHGLVDLKRWPAEPPSPPTIDVARLGGALKELCGGWMPPSRPGRYAEWIVTYAGRFGIDPFLLAAVVYRHSRCLSQEQSAFGLGLTKIDPEMHAAFIRKKQYRYWVLEKGSWQEKQLLLDRFAFVSGNLRRAESNIYFAAALLAVAKEQCPQIDGAFGSVPHRHFVSHFIWGDQVKGTMAEDRVFNARRRLLEYYQGQTLQPLGIFHDLPLRCPLDGAPRVVTSVMGSDRNEGKRFHKGIDFLSTYGEPVRAVADGQVILAGLDRPSGGPINLDPEAALAVRRSQMGPGGLFVMILHAGGLRSAYMHLSQYCVKANQQVKAGELIGTVGKTGVKESGAHLHFELRHEGQHQDPMPCLAGYVIAPQETYLGRFVDTEEQRARRIRRIRHYKELKATQEAGAQKGTIDH